MADNTQHFESFQPHTLLKHAFWRSYLGRWAHILLWNQPRRSRLRVVDACAGEGTDAGGNPGSPLIAMEEAEKAREHILADRQRSVSIQVLAIEQHPGRFRKLAEAVEAVGEPHRAMRGTLSDAMGALEAEFDTTPTLFFIDPFGLEPLRGNLVRRALAGEKNEVFLLFADQAALRHVGVLRKVADDAAPGQPSLFDSPEEEESTPSRISSNLQLTAEAAEGILDAAFDRFEWRRALDAPPTRRRQALLDIYTDFLHDAGATRVLRIPVMNERTHLKYHLVHASRHGAAYRAMKEAIESGWRRGIVGAQAVRLMRLGVDCRVDEVVRQARERLAGTEIPWDAEDRRTPDLKKFVLEETPAMPGQTGEVRRQLEPFAVQGRRGWYRFPVRNSDQQRL